MNATRTYPLNLAPSTQLELPTQRDPNDALSVLEYLSTSVHEVNRLRSLFVGAIVLGSDSMRYSQGFWRRIAVPVPVTFERLRHVKGCLCGLSPNDTEECPMAEVDAEAARRFDCIGVNLGWRFHYFTALPEYRCVETAEVKYVDSRSRTRMKVRTPRQQLATYALHEYRRLLPQIRDALEEHLSLGRCAVFGPEDITDGLRHAPDHWYRAACALLDYGSRWLWFGRRRG